MTDTETRSPELRLAQGVLAGLRQDLFNDAFAYRPLQPMRTDGPLTRRLPGRIRARARWIPHAVVLGFALITLLLAAHGTVSFEGPLSLLTGLISAAAVVMTLVRPVGAWWVSLASAPVVSLLGSSWGSWPWPDSVFLAHLVVVTVVAARTSPRTAAWMWAGTALYGFLTGAVVGPVDMNGSNMALMLFLSAVALLVTTTVQVRREAHREVTAQQTVTAIERDRRTLLEERTTIARELHDVVAHHMSVVAIQAEAAPYRVTDPPPELTRSFEVIRENAVAALTELRRVLGVVRAEDYEAPDAPQPTLAELEGLLTNVREAGLAVEKTVTGAVRELPQGVELSAYRIIQEALSNTLRHAPGSQARVEISYVLGGLGLRVINGPPQGLVKPSPGAGHGLTGMRERVTMLNGEITTESTEDGGYEIAAFIPVQRSAEESE
ncbi:MULTISPECIES: histidine kinase [unclassified Streptomyces]|uniref:sensor histidine kinase n=1 Tax=unclassified Streptomyces TaxID=2593676 RepID=UPI002E109394|nr:histidine kinase [Streptomyces sp. NBC_01197]WSS50633.1 histidine kinase [Streptomyces sp. NBC_01180]